MKDELEKIADGESLDYLGRSFAGNYIGGITGGTLGAGAGAGIGALIGALNKRPTRFGVSRAKAMAGSLGLLGGLAGAGLGSGIGHAKGVKSYIKNQTGKDVSTGNALLQDSITTMPRALLGNLGGAAVGGGLGAGIGALTSKGRYRRNPLVRMAGNAPAKFGSKRVRAAKIGLALGLAAGSSLGGLYGTTLGAKELKEKNKQ